MIIQCKSCSRKFVVKDKDIPVKGRTVQCGYCSVTWHQMPLLVPADNTKIESAKISENLSVESIKASDGKTYKFLGNQWAHLLPSGKTGLFAKKKIGKELDKLTGRQEVKAVRKKIKKSKTLDPSSEKIISSQQLPEIYKPKQGIGFFGYIFLIIIVSFSAVGFLKTFEDDLIDNFPEIEYLYSMLENQLNYIAETVKNIIVIIKDLIKSY
jgi:predicted Zn finger-like uncharacterized protein